MSMTAVPHATPDARTLLNSLLELIGQTHRVQDITPERLASFMGTQVTTWSPTHYGFGGKVTPEWNYLVEMQGTSLNCPFMQFAFSPATMGATPDVSDICSFDFAAFERALHDAGFSGEPYYGEHGEVLWHNFSRDQLRLEVGFRRETDAKAARSCVDSVILR